MLAGAAQTYLNRYGVKVGDRPAIVTAHDSAWHAAFDLAEAGAKPAAIVDVRPAVDPALTDRARALGIETLLGRTVTGTSGRLRVKSLRVNRIENGKAGAARDDRLRHRADVRRLDPVPAPLLATPRAASPGTTTLKAFLPGDRSPRPCTSPAPAAASGASPPPSPTAPPPARRPPATPAATAAAQVHAVTADRTGSGVTLQGAADRPQPGDRQGLRRLPERRHRQGHPPRGPRGHALDRARQALHHQRHGDRPGQDVERQRPDDRRRRARQGAAAGRPHHLPPALHADDLRHLRRLPPGRHLRASPGGPRSTPGPRRRARSSSRSRSGAAPGTSRKAPRTCTPRSPASAAPPAPRSASSTPRPSARSRSPARTPSPSWSGCTPTPGPSSASAAAATACCSARTASSATTASSAGWRRTASTSPPPPAAPRASST